jgi:hypothetical protein
MAVLKLSAITASGSNPAATDRFVGVTAANADVLFTQAQVQASLGAVGVVTITQPATGSTLTIADGKTLTVSNSLTLAGTDAQTMTFPTTSATIARIDAGNTFLGTQTFSATGPTITLSNNSCSLRFRNNADSQISTPANSTYRLGASLDVAAPAAQTLSVQNVLAGNANNAGANFTIIGSKSNGSGGGDVVIQTTNANAASGTQNTAATALTIKAGTPAGNAGDTIAAGFLQSTAGFTQVTSIFSKTTDTALANVTGLSSNLIAAGVYAFRAVLFVTADATGGHKYAIGGTCSATAIIYNIVSVSNSASTIVISSKQTALAGAAGQAGATDVYTTIEGLITVNAAGTLTVQFAQNASNLTSSVVVGSFMLVNRVA